MLRLFQRRRIGPALQRELATVTLAGQARKTVCVVVLCSRAGLRMIRRHHGVVFASEALPCAVVPLPPPAILSLSRDHSILMIEKDETFAPAPRPLTITGPRNADVYARYKVGRLRQLDGQGIRIMIQDTGVSSHSDMSKAKITALDCTGDGTMRDHHGHGTAIVSQLVATGSYPGLVPGAEIVMARIFGHDDMTSLSRVLKACSAALERNVHIVNMSYGGPIPNLVIALAMRKLYEAGICLIAASGNSGPDLNTIEYPAGFSEVLGVAAVDKQGQLAPFSSRGRPGQRPMKPDLATEGVNIVMAESPDGFIGQPVAPGYIMASGTSFSAPIAAGLAAMILEARRAKSPPEAVYATLRESGSR